LLIVICYLQDAGLPTEYSAEDARNKRKQNQYPNDSTGNECQDANASENPN
jgi:hypothetical protein